MSFSPKVNLEVFLCFSLQLWSCDMPREQKLKMKEIGGEFTLFRKKLVFLKEDKHTKLSTFGMNVREV